MANKKKKADLSKMRAEIKWSDDMWGIIKDNALFTIHKENGKYPTSEWKRRMLLCEHSPIRSGRIIINVYDVPSFAITHFVRHHQGLEKFVATFRDDRLEYDEVPNRNTLQNFRLDINFQAFINMSRRRCCTGASYETRMIWKLILDTIREVEPELADVCVADCVYRGHCYEYTSCNYHKSKAYKEELARYRKGINE